ncbi:hypothetical protein OSB04_014750 [Centaurea solstitialis]|uniref:Uncharacterized protein n=1 Tax=Centaurea solstitialis TaxID=347529 RepID=A0AA38T9M7_9ASTR|nr:hypothetical protein OSB04_014750 [Centaurea solstitialis]
MIRTQFNANIKILRSDNGTEYVSEVLGSYLTENGIVHQSSCTNTPQQNGEAERKNRHILEISRSLMFTTNGEEMEEACFWECSTIPNPIPIQSAENTPVEIPNHSEATPSVQIPSAKNTQVENQVEKPPMIHTYAHRNKPHVLQSDPVLQADQQSEPRGLDQEMQMEPGMEHGIQLETNHEFVDDASRNDELPIALRKGSTKIPRNIDEALKDPLWKQAVLEEMTALRKNDTWSLVKLPNGKETLGCRWLFNIKFNADGSINRYKARLVARGFTQTYGVDYSETFAPVAKLNTVRVLMSLAANENWPLYQLDVKNAFLNGNLEEEVFMDIPSGFQNEKNKGLVCRLKRSLYGLKQSPRAWFKKFGGTMKHLRFIQGQADHTLFYKHSVKGEITILIVYVDDIIITGSDNVEIENVKKALAQAFEIKDLGVLKYFLGMEVARSKKGISITQHKYIIDLLKETGMIGCKPISTPIDSNVKLNAYDGELVEKGRYQRLVGRLIYLSHTRPDIAFVVSRVSQFMHAPRQPHMLVVFRILQYLKSTPGKGLFFKSENTPQVEIYTDSDWGGCPKDGRSTTGYCTFVYGNLVTWKSKKQPVVSRSTAEAELRAVAQAARTIDFKSELKQLGISLRGITCNFDKIRKLNQEAYLDSTMFTSVIEKAEDLVYKCLKIKRNFIKKFAHLLKLKDVNKKLLRVFQVEAEVDQHRNLKEVMLMEVKRIKLKAEVLSETDDSFVSAASSISEIQAISEDSYKESATSSLFQGSQSCRHFEFPEILQATNNFDESLVIGRGGFGKVYKGNVMNGSSLVVVAIKRLESTSSQGAAEFWAEVEMLSGLRHCNLVSLIGYCNYEKEKIIVYEYMSNGTLADHLHRHGTPLSWIQRLKICIGAGRGLHYLHTGTRIEVAIIHRDVKTSNILLHENWAAKISDFGLSKSGPTDQPSTYVNTKVRGTFGYLDPDYYATGKLTRKSDVYAFGVVLLEVLCRKRAVDRSLDEEQWNLARWAQESIKEGKLKNIIDSDIRGQISPKCLKEFVLIAKRCLHNDPKKRPTMADVVGRLESILNDSLEIATETMLDRMLGMLTFPSKGENSGNSSPY